MKVRCIKEDNLPVSRTLHYCLWQQTVQRWINHYPIYPWTLENIKQYKMWYTVSRVHTRSTKINGRKSMMILQWCWKGIYYIYCMFHYPWVLKHLLQFFFSLFPSFYIKVVLVLFPMLCQCVSMCVNVCQCAGLKSGAMGNLFFDCVLKRFDKVQLIYIFLCTVSLWSNIKHNLIPPPYTTALCFDINIYMECWKK